jgi:hypothetical protein
MSYTIFGSAPLPAMGHYPFMGAEAQNTLDLKSQTFPKEVPQVYAAKDCSTKYCQEEKIHIINHSL